jgi:WD40 repeat protein
MHCSIDKSEQLFLSIHSWHSGSYSYLHYVKLALAWSPDGTQLASGSIDQTVQVWLAPN